MKKQSRRKFPPADFKAKGVLGGDQEPANTGRAGGQVRCQSCDDLQVEVGIPGEYGCRV